MMEAKDYAEIHARNVLSALNVLDIKSVEECRYRGLEVEHEVLVIRPKKRFLSGIKRGITADDDPQTDWQSGKAHDMYPQKTKPA